MASFTTTSLPPGIPTYDSGSCGFFEYPGQAAQFRDLDVVGPHTIAVRWAQSPTSGAFSLQVSAPKGTTGNISVPVPTVGATVTIRAVGNANVLRSIQTIGGTTFQSINVPGGRTYRLNVLPMTSAHN